MRVLWRPPAADTADAAGQLRVLRWLTDRHPELQTSGRLAAHHLAEIACWEVASGHRDRGYAYACAALRSRRREPLALFALAAVAGLARGRGLRAWLRRHHPIP